MRFGFLIRLVISAYMLASCSVIEERRGVVSKAQTYEQLDKTPPDLFLKTSEGLDPNVHYSKFYELPSKVDSQFEPIDAKLRYGDYSGGKVIFKSPMPSLTIKRTRFLSDSYYEVTVYSSEDSSLQSRNLLYKSSSEDVSRIEASANLNTGLFLSNPLISSSGLKKQEERRQARLKAEKERAELKVLQEELRKQEKLKAEKVEEQLKALEAKTKKLERKEAEERERVGNRVAELRIPKAIGTDELGPTGADTLDFLKAKRGHCDITYEWEKDYDTDISYSTEWVAFRKGRIVYNTDVYGTLGFSWRYKLTADFPELDPEVFVAGSTVNVHCSKGSCFGGSLIRRLPGSNKPLERSAFRSSVKIHMCSARDASKYADALSYFIRLHGGKASLF